MESKKAYIEGVVKEHIGGLHLEMKAQLDAHIAIVDSKVLVLQQAYTELENRVVELEENRLSTSLRRDQLIALTNNIIGINQYYRGWVSAQD